MSRVLGGTTTWSFVLLLLGSSALAGYLALQMPPPKPPPAVVVSPEVADFGTVGQGESHVAEYHVFNGLSAAIELLTVQTSCSCTKFEIEPKQLPPGETATVKVHWTSTTSRGLVQLPALLVVKYPDGKNVGHRLQIQAKVEPDILFSPETLQFAAGTPSTQRLMLTPGRLPQFQAKEAFANHSSFAIRPAPGTANAFDVTYTPEPGGLPPRLFVSVVTDSKNEPTLSVPITVTGTAEPVVPSHMPGENR